MGEKKRAGIDMDSTLTKCLELWLFCINRDRGTSFTVDDIQGWDFEGPIREKFDLVKDLLPYLQIPGFFREMAPIAGAIEGVRALEKHYDVWIITAEASEHSKVEKREWIKEYLPGLENKIIFSHAKHEHQFDLLVDDKTSTILKYREVYPNALVTGLEYAYNRGIRGIYTNWHEIVLAVTIGGPAVLNEMRGRQDPIDPAFD